MTTTPSVKEARETVTKHLVYAIANDLERSIMALGYPVGMGVAPAPEVCEHAAQRIVAKITDAALTILAEREALQSKESGE